MKRTLLALVAATFAFAAGSSFAQAPAEPTAPAATKAAKPAKPSSKAKSTHKVAHKKPAKTAHAA
ncbi:MAG: hypothetical protein EOP82_03430 [Variovorax sp.]|nr:MAG: hypothetical protein EOP82_03430 [Variovorax sp.]